MAQKMTQKLTLTAPDDFHCHLRDGALLKAVAPITAQNFRRAIIMPNLSPPICTYADLLAYRARIMQALPEKTDFTPLMTLYLTDDSNPEDITRAYQGGDAAAVKLYPANATTHSAHGVTHWHKVKNTLAAMEKIGMPLLIHGEITSPESDIFDREARFIDDVLVPLRAAFPALRIVLEHITTAEAAAYVQENISPGSEKQLLGATITPHHLLLNRNALFAGGLRPHHYCLPILKRERHREVVLKAATSGASCFFLGTDSAPHTVGAKESACGCAGIFNSLEGLGLYAEIFESVGALHHLENFASLNGARFYGLSVNKDQVTLVKTSFPVPEKIEVENGETIVPFRAGEEISWQLERSL